MKSSRVIPIIFLYLLSLNSGVAQSQYIDVGVPNTSQQRPLPPIQDIAPINFKKVGVERNLYPEVGNIIQDKKGFIWFDSDSGLSRYDGVEFKRFKHSALDSNSLSASQIFQFYIDPTNTLWVVSYDGTLHWYNPQLENFHRFSLTIDRVDQTDNIRVKSVLKDSYGIFWVVSQPDYSITEVIAFHEEEAGIVWIGTDNDGLFKFDRRTGTIDLITLPGGDITSIELKKPTPTAPEKALWLGTDFGLKFSNIKEGTVSDWSPSNIEAKFLEDCTVYNMVKSEDGKLWVNCSDKVFYIEEATQKIHWVELIYQGQPIDGKVDLDNQANTWITTEDLRLFKFDVQTSELFHIKFRLEKKRLITHQFEFQTFYRDQQTRQWIGSKNGLILLIPPKNPMGFMITKGLQKLMVLIM